MSTYIPAQALVAIGAVAAALIAAAIAYVNLTLTKEQKTSDFRQAWIDALREELSKFFAAVRTVARAEDGFYQVGNGYSQSNFPWDNQQIADQRQQASEMLYRIKLRLNPDEKDHKELYNLLATVITRQNELGNANPDAEVVIKAIDAACDYARPVLKAEWDRVKLGETPFRLARNWVAPVIIGLSMIFIALLLLLQFK